MSEITKALIKFKKATPAIIKDKTAEVTSKRTGGHFQYRYADLAEVMGTIDPSLADCGLFLSQAFSPNGVTYLVTTVMHESGEKIESRIELPINGLSPQEVGSVITYYRRYSVLALLGLAAEDDDGKAADDAGVKHGSKALTQQLKDSVAAEHKNGGDHIAAEKFVLDKSYAPFLKETPAGKCWKVTAIQTAIRNFVHDLNGQSDAVELKGFLADNNAVLDACAIALPNWYYGKSGSDIPSVEKRIADKRAELAKASADNPGRYLRA